MPEESNQNVTNVTVPLNIINVFESMKQNRRDAIERQKLAKEQKEKEESTNG